VRRSGFAGRGEVREANVENGEIWRMTVEMIEPFLSGGNVCHREIFSLEGIDQGVRNGGFVFDKQYGGHLLKMLKDERKSNNQIFSSS
jgi:hypothetical protein